MDSEIRQEVEVLKNLGFDHVLLVTGEANHTVNINYFLNAIDVIKMIFRLYLKCNHSHKRNTSACMRQEFILF
jgi:2-iminoacetate synthase ThiH